jgi:hypothetical protein
MHNNPRPWKKSRTFGDIYGGRMRMRLDDNIFRRAHSLKRPGISDELPILVQDNPSRDFFFPISVEEAKAAIEALPNDDHQGITHIWMSSVKNLNTWKIFYLRKGVSRTTDRSGVQG